LLINTKAEEIDKKGVFEPSVDFNAVNLKFNTSTFNFFAPCLNLDYKIDRYKISLSYLFGQDSEQVGNFDFKVKINDLSARLSYRLIKQDNSKLYFNTNLKSFKLSSEWGNLSDSDTWSGLGVGLGYEFNKDKYGIDLNLNYYPTLDSSNIPDYSLFELSAVFRYTINPKLQAYLNVVSNKFNSLDNNSDIDYTRFGIGLKFKI
jgi:hypothetical protein